MAFQRRFFRRGFPKLRSENSRGRRGCASGRSPRRPACLPASNTGGRSLAKRSRPSNREKKPCTLWDFGRCGCAITARLQESRFRAKNCLPRLPRRCFQSSRGYSKPWALLTLQSIPRASVPVRSEEHTSELQSPDHLVCRLLLEKKKTILKTDEQRAAR